jgi:hypothetical protein
VRYGSFDSSNSIGVGFAELHLYHYKHVVLFHPPSKRPRRVCGGWSADLFEVGGGGRGDEREHA